MRRSLSGLILLVAGGLFALAVGAFWMERVAFTPDVDTDKAFAILDDEEIRRQVASIVAGADAVELGKSANEVRPLVEEVAQIRAGATEMRRFTAAAHARIIGESDDIVEITAAEQVQILRTERAAVLPDITLPVTRSATLAVVATVNSWVWTVSFALAGVALLLGLVTRPERGEGSFAFACTCAATGASLVVFGYLVPSFVLTSATDDVWVGALSRLADFHRNTTLVAAAAFVVLGAASALLTSGNRRRRQRSTPLAATRFREQQRWSG